MSACCASRTNVSESSPRYALTHPLQPLTPDEIAAAVSAVRADPPYGEQTRFETIELHEPAKSIVRGFTAGDPISRWARVNVFDERRIGVTRLTVDLDAGAIISRQVFPKARPMIQLEQFTMIEEVVRRDPDFIAACARRGITDMTSVCIDPWSAGSFDIPGEEDRLLAHVFAWVRLYENENFYAHPIAGLNAVLDILAQTVIRVDDHGSIPIPQTEVNYDSDLVPPRVSTLRPIDIVQPEGVSFRREGNRLLWDRWSLVVGFNSREALTLHDLTFDERPVIYRGSIVEMVVPYGSPDAGHFRKNVFDIGEYGLGKLANSLKLGCDCLGSIEYLDVHLNTMMGATLTIENAICIHEEDAGLLWKHWDFRTERAEVRRGRKLVISCICTVGNYEYALYWYLFLDGTIEFEIKATGIINTTACLPSHPGRYGREVSPGVLGHIHQHLFCARLDMAVDGDLNSVVELNTHSVPMGPDNPYGNVFFEEETIFRTEREACRRANAATQRSWKVINPDKRNHVGTPVGYVLNAMHMVTPFVSPESPSGRRAAFTRNHVWVTAFDPEERYPGGEYMNHSDGHGDLQDISQQDRSIENADIVLWHVFGLHHPVRPEDFPVQPCVTTGFKLLPNGFFDANPTIDLPASINAASCQAQASR